MWNHLKREHETVNVENSITTYYINGEMGGLVLYDKKLSEWKHWVNKLKKVIYNVWPHVSMIWTYFAFYWICFTFLRQKCDDQWYYTIRGIVFHFVEDYKMFSECGNQKVWVYILYKNAGTL